MTNDTLTPEAPAHLLADPRSALTSALAICGDLIHTVRPDELDRPTPCGDMDVRALLGHLVMVARRIECAARLVPTHEWPTDATGLADDEWAPAYHEAAADALAAWSEDRLLDEVMVLPWASMPGREVVGIYVNEVIVHGWDLGRGVGREPQWPADALAVAEVAIHSQLPDADREPMWAEVKATLPPGIPWANPFDNAVPVAADVSPIERIVAWNGRQP